MSDDRAESQALRGEALKHPFLDGLSREHLAVLASCAMRVKFAEGEVVFREGDPANRFFCLLEGEVEIRAARGLAEPMAVQALGGGDVLGWSWMCFPYQWSLDAVATRPTRAIFFYATRLRERCEENPALGYALMKRVAEVMMQRLGAARRSLVEERAA